MSSVNPSPHLDAAKRKPVFKTDYGLVVLTICTACPELRPFKGVLLQYLSTMFTCVDAEGEQAVKRYKAYKSMFLEVIATSQLPSRKFRHAMPIYRLACQFRTSPFILACLHTVLRSYDLFQPSQSAINNALQEFERQFLTDTPDGRLDYESITVEDGDFVFKKEILDVIKDPAFRSFERKVPFSDYFNPIEQAILLSKKGTSRFSRGHKPLRVRGFAPSIVGSSSELEFSTEFELPGGDHYYDLLRSFGNTIGTLSQPSMRLAKPEYPLENTLSSVLRRNVAFGNPGFKTRIIAVADYWTQYILSPVHQWAFKCLQAISADYTFSHEKGFSVLSDFTSRLDHISCFDLSSATDAFPASFSREVLRQVLPGGSDLAPKWYRIMTEVPFGKQWYKVGQPMGLLSSWSVFALSHHFVIWIAAKKAGLLKEVLKEPKQFYLLVGDDVVILHPTLAHYYSIIMGILGVKINLNKSLITSSTRRVTEFVKRNSFNGEDISAISPRLILKSFKDYSCLRELILLLRSRYPEGNDRARPSSFDEQAFVNLHKMFGASYKKRVISTMCSVPIVYTGLHPDSSECRALWPPLVRLTFLTMRALNTLEFKLRGIYISSEGRDSFNDLVNWQLEDLMSSRSLPHSQFYEYMRKSTLEASALLGSRDTEASFILSQIAQKVHTARYSYLPLDECYSFEDSILSRLRAFSPPTTFTVKETERIQTRSLNFKIHKVINAYGSKESFLSNPQYATLRVDYLLKRFSFSLPQDISPEEMYRNLFFSRSIPEDT